MLEFFEYRPVLMFQTSDADFWLDLYFGDDSYNYLVDYNEFPRLHRDSDGTIQFWQCRYDDELTYRGFQVMVSDRVYIANAEIQIAWYAELPDWDYSGSGELFKVAEVFIDSWYYSQPSPGQLAIPELALN